MQIFSTRLRELRTEFKFTQQQLSEMLNIRQQSYARYENGKGEPDLETVVKIANIFKVSCDYLLGITDI